MGKKFYIKERRNPQIGVYYVACGQLTKAKAKQAERSIYGDNFMLAFDTESAYLDCLSELRASGKHVQ